MNWDIIMKYEYILCHRNKIAFVYVAKSGCSTLLYLAFKNHYEGNLLDKYGYKHGRIHANRDIWGFWWESVPVNIRDTIRVEKDKVPDDYKQVMFVRNPYSRIWSGWEMYRRCDMISLSFERFLLDEIYWRKEHDEHFVMHHPVIRNLQSDVLICRFENIQQELKLLLHDEISIPHQNMSDNLPYAGMSIDARNIITLNYAADCHLLDYAFDKPHSWNTITAGQLRADKPEMFSKG